MDKKESAKSIIIFAIFLFSPIIIPPALIILFSYRDTNIGFAKEVEINIKNYLETTYLKNISKEEKKMNLTTYIKNSFFIKYYTAKAFFNTVFMRVSLLYAILAVFTGIIPNTKNEIKEFYRIMKEDKKSLLFTLFLFANVITITVLCVINAKSKIEYLAFSAIIFRKILDTFLEKYS
ncbi:hypothetical protein R4Q14_07665 [Brachyspira intermedia]|uniref:hypothetical protein n=1 Tax=Brachyspira intermedia TaxID=84377 RepID=UPI003006E1CF